MPEPSASEPSGDARRSTVIDSLDELALVSVTLVPHRDQIDATQAVGVIDAAADAGFTGFCGWVMHHDWAVADGMASERFLEHHRERNVQIHSLSLCSSWTSSDHQNRVDETRHLLDVAVRAGARGIVAVCLEPELPPLADAACWLAEVCDRSADEGLRVSVEFIPGTGIPDLAFALRLFDAVDRDNIGLVLDAFQWFRAPGGPDVATLRGISPERIHILQLDDMRRPDVESRPDPAGPERLCPGDGDIDLVALLNLLHYMKAAPLVATEVLSPALLNDLGQQQMARVQFTSTAAVLERHWAALSADPLAGSPV
jgi:sugar phosphate isomerase/epimerase